MKKNKLVQKYKFTISSSGGDGAFLCIQKISKEIHEYFQSRKLSLEDFALDEEYSISKEIPEEMHPFQPGVRAEFGSYECGMSASDSLELIVENENSDEIFSGTITHSNIKKIKNGNDYLKNYEKGIYAVGYEGLEDCYIEGEFELEANFDIKKFKVHYAQIDYEVSSRDMIMSVTYEDNDVEWYLSSYEGTGDNKFDFIEIK